MAQPLAFVRRLRCLNSASLRLLALPGLGFYAFWIDPAIGSGGIPCLWRLMSGMECFGCGLSRAAGLLFRGHLMDAVEMNWVIVPTVLVVGYCFAKEIVNPSHVEASAWRS